MLRKWFYKQKWTRCVWLTFNTFFTLSILYGCDSHIFTVRGSAKANAYWKLLQTMFHQNGTEWPFWSICFRFVYCFECNFHTITLMYVRLRMNMLDHCYANAIYSCQAPFPSAVSTSNIIFFHLCYHLSYARSASCFLLFYHIPLIKQTNNALNTRCNDFSLDEMLQM